MPLIKHGMKDAPEYRAWRGLRGRCNNPNDRAFKYYGGRGIAFCDRWNDFAAFYLDMGQRPSPAHSIERKDNDKGYQPDNCEWATKATQNRNRSNTVFVLFRGRHMTLADAVEVAGSRTTYRNAHRRIFDRGWSIERAVEVAP